MIPPSSSLNDPRSKEGASSRPPYLNGWARHPWHTEAVPFSLELKDYTFGGPEFPSESPQHLPEAETKMAWAGIGGPNGPSRITTPRIRSKKPSFS